MLKRMYFNLYTYIEFLMTKTCISLVQISPISKDVLHWECDNAFEAPAMVYKMVKGRKLVLQAFE